jgi:hypothetical protein
MGHGFTSKTYMIFNVLYILIIKIILLKQTMIKISKIKILDIQLISFYVEVQEMP